LAIRGPVSHLDLTVTELERSVAFYDRLLGALGFRHLEDAGDPSWFQRYPGGGYWGIALRLAPPRTRARRHDRWLPGVHHIAFHAQSRADVDRVYSLLRDVGAEVLDPPAEYSGAAYSAGYYAVFFADPDGLKLELVYEPRSNP
jgi:catechol 2,3-dioxygenase-like lactoylglutathione lyase family enzyme